MTQIHFYTNAADKLHTACRIVFKAYGFGHKIYVCCPDGETAKSFDRLLWSTPAAGFIPHCTPDDALVSITPVIVDHRGAEPSHDQLLLNLRADRAPYFSRFERLIEIVSLDPEDRSSARDRYKFYRDRGYEIRTHDLGGAPQT